MKSWPVYGISEKIWCKKTFENRSRVSSSKLEKTIRSEYFELASKCIHTWSTMFTVDRSDIDEFEQELELREQMAGTTLNDWVAILIMELERYYYFLENQVIYLPAIFGIKKEYLLRASAGFWLPAWFSVQFTTHIATNFQMLIC